MPTDIFKHLDMSGGLDACWPYTGYYNERARNCYWSCGGKSVIPYRVVYELVHGVTLETAQHVLHTCDNKGCPDGKRLCCNPRHMYLGNQQQNSNDMKQRERHGLPHHTVRAMKNLMRAGVSDQEIADRFGISRRHVNNIRNGNRYAHVEELSNDKDESEPSDTAV